MSRLVSRLIFNEREQRAWYRGKCLDCTMWYLLSIFPNGKQTTPICPNCTGREVDLDTIEPIPAELAEEWSFQPVEPINQRELIHLIAMQTRHAPYIERLNG